MSAKTDFYMQLVGLAVFALVAVVQAILHEWRPAGLFATGAVVYLIAAYFSRRKMTGS
jgi:uncharacterized membrane protein